MLGTLVFIIALVLIGVFVYTQYFVPKRYILRFEKPGQFGVDGAISVNNIDKNFDDLFRFYPTDNSRDYILNKNYKKISIVAYDGQSKKLDGSRITIFENDEPIWFQVITNPASTIVYNF